MTTSVANLTSRLDTALANSGDITAIPWLWRPLLELLSGGAPVDVDTIAAAAGRPAAEVQATLAGAPSVEWDDRDRVIGAFLTLRPAQHRFTLDGRTLYTWCALDTLIFPAILGRPAQVSSPCRATGETVRLTVEPDRVRDVEPSTAVVSLVVPKAGGPVRASFCANVHFFRSPEVARPWLDEHPEATAVAVTKTASLGLRLMELRGMLPAGRAAHDETL